MIIKVEVEDSNYTGGKDVIAKFEIDLEIMPDDIFNKGWDLFLNDFRTCLYAEYLKYTVKRDDT